MHAMTGVILGLGRLDQGLPLRKVGGLTGIEMNAQTVHLVVIIPRKTLSHLESHGEKCLM